MFEIWGFRPGLGMILGASALVILLLIFIIFFLSYPFLMMYQKIKLRREMMMDRKIRAVLDADPVATEEIYKKTYENPREEEDWNLKPLYDLVMARANTDWEYTRRSVQSAYTVYYKQRFNRENDY